MTPEIKFHSIVITITTALVYGVWIVFLTLVQQHPWLAVAVSAFISLGVYQTLVAVLTTILRKCSWMKRFILGPSFLQGTWVGFFIGHGQQVRFIVETFEQELGRLVIRGRAFRDNGVFHVSWVAENATFDSERGKLVYHYQADGIGNSFINPGIADFSVERSGSDQPPVGLVGFSSDLFNPQKLLAFEEKLSDSTFIDDATALEKARTVYERRKHFAVAPIPSSTKADAV